MPTPESRKDRRERQAREVEKSQQDMRDSIARTKVLLDESDNMIRRHRREREEGGDDQDPD